MTIPATHPLIDWLYDNPSWLVGLVIIAVTVVFALAGVLAVHRWVDRDLRQGHNDITGAASTIVGTVAAVLLAFISVSTWETFSRDQDIADGESTAITNLYFNTASIASVGEREAIQEHLRRYTETVIHTEWPAQRAGRLDGDARKVGSHELIEVNLELAAMDPQTIGAGNIQAQLMTSLSQLLVDRRQRLIAAEDHVDGDVWGVILLGTALAIASTWVFGPRSLKMHMFLSSLVAISMAFVIVLIVATDYPFRGAVSMGTESYEVALQAMLAYDAATPARSTLPPKP